VYVSKRWKEVQVVACKVGKQVVACKVGKEVFVTVDAEPLSDALHRQHFGIREFRRGATRPQAKKRQALSGQSKLVVESDKHGYNDFV
jgi:hypothetical protein